MTDGLKGFLLLMLLGSLVACDVLDEEKPQSELGGDPLTLAIGESGEWQTDKGPLTLTVKNIVDNRCPTNAQCFVAGVAVITLGAMLDGEEEEIFASDQDDAAAFGYIIQILDVSPYPQSGTVDLSAYRVTINLQALPDTLACTDDAMQCTDGSFVARNPQRACAFDPCPKEPVFCTEDVRICADGSASTRDHLNNCEFTPCPEELIVCTADAKQCLDGSWVGRTQPNCEFSPCP